MEHKTASVTKSTEGIFAGKQCHSTNSDFGERHGRGKVSGEGGEQKQGAQQDAPGSGQDAGLIAVGS